MDASWKDAAVMISALGGLGLGVYNTITAALARRPRMRATAVLLSKGSTKVFGIEVVNLSPTPVTIVEVGVARADPFHRLRTMLWPTEVRIGRLPIRSVSEDDKPTPLRLPSNDAVILIGEQQGWMSTDMPLRRVYVKLASGAVSYGAGPAMPEVREMNAIMRTQRI